MLSEELARIERKLDQMSEVQNEINTDVAAIQGAFTTLAGDVTALTSYIQGLVTNGQAPDLSQLDALAQSAASSVAAVTNLLPATPAPAPSEPAQPSAG